MNTVSVKKKSYLFNMLATYGLISSTETKIANMRKAYQAYYTTTIYNSQIDNTVYGKSHIILPVDTLDKLELWFEGRYLDISKCQIVKTYLNGESVILLDKYYDSSFTMKYFINEYVKYRATQSGTGNSPSYNFSIVIPRKDITLSNNYYAVVDNKFTDNIYVSKDATNYYVLIPYESNCDFFVCSNLVFAKHMEANTSQLVTPVDDPIICGTYIFDTNSEAILNTKFYPHVGVNETGFLRVFNNIHYMLDSQKLEYIRYCLYPEFGSPSNPYDPAQNPNSGIIFTDDVILPDDSVDVIVDKFSRLSKEYSRVINIFEPLDKIFDIFENVFTIKEMVIDGYITQVIISNIHFDKNRDVLYHKGKIYTDYLTASIVDIDMDYCEFSDRGYPRQYIIYEDGLDPDDFVIMKICAENNPTIKNIASDILYLGQTESGSNSYRIDLDRRMQELYENFLFVKNNDFVLYEESTAVVSSDTPIDNLHYDVWFEIMNGKNYDKWDYPYSGFNPPIDDSDFKNDNVVGLFLTESAVKLADNGDVIVADFEYDRILNLYNENALSHEINETISSIEYTDSRYNQIVDVFIYKDTAMIFRNYAERLRYNRIFVDLLNSDMVEHRKLMVMNNELMDNAKLDGMELVAESVVDTFVIDESDDTIRTGKDTIYIYSNNLRRISIYREDLNYSDLRSLDINRMVNLNGRGVYFDIDDFIVYINGQYIKKSSMSITTKNRFIVDYIGQINRIDIIYNALDEDLHRLKNVIA